MFYSRSVTEHLALYPQLLLMYNGIIKIGNPSVSVPVLFDTGSCQLWIEKSLLGKSSTYVSQNRVAPTISYLDGTVVDGFFSNDDVTIGNTTVRNLEFETATSIRGDLQSVEDPIRAIMGLCYSGRGSSSTNFIEASVASRLMTNRLFSYYVEEHSKSAVLTFDDVVQKNGTVGDIVYSPIDSSSSSWGLTMTKMSIGNVTVLTEETTAVVDTGTSLVIVPSDIALNVGKLLNFSFRNGYFTGACKNVLNRTLSLSFYNMDLSLPLENLMLSEDGISCTSTVIEGSPGLIVLGNAFLKHFLTVFDADKARVGFISRSNGSFIDPSQNGPTDKNIGNDDWKNITAYVFVAVVSLGVFTSIILLLRSFYRSYRFSEV